MPHLVDKANEFQVTQAVFLTTLAFFKSSTLPVMPIAPNASRKRVMSIRTVDLRKSVLPHFNSKGYKGPEVGPVLKLHVPIFNKNEGGVLRACTELDAAKYNRDQKNCGQRRAKFLMR